MDYSTDGRLIHDGSYPLGKLITDAVPSIKLDDITDDVKEIARRVLYLYDKFQCTEIFGKAADVDSAFQNAHANEMSALLFGGSLLDSPYIAIALTAIFGYIDSPGIFALLAKTVQHYHRVEKSKMNGILTSVWSWVRVDDFVGIKPGLDNRLLSSELRLRSAFLFIFGSTGWNINKYASWSNILHAVGLDWGLIKLAVSMPGAKI